ncbi:MAG TPA: HAD family hydrolase [Solirubrobacterales bacterium]|nr:HAD family hydrolase [Solirubrobacterales bacterium]
MIEAVTFDFWNTIAQAPAGMMTEARQRAVAAACAAHEVEVEEALLLGSLEEVTRSYERSWTSGVHFHPRDGAEMLSRSVGADGVAAEAIAEAFLTAGQDVSLDFAPGIRAALDDLVARGIRIGIVCDVGFSGGELLRDLLAREGLLDRFSGWAFSDEVGHYKPAPQIFEAALLSLDVATEAAMHVGDLRRTDVAGAGALGMRTVRYRALHDDPGLEGEIEADFVLDHHRELPAILDRIGASSP